MSTDNIPKSIRTPVSWEMLFQRVDELEQKLAVAVETLNELNWGFIDLVHAAANHKGEINPDWLEETILNLANKPSEALAMINVDVKKESE